MVVVVSWLVIVLGCGGSGPDGGGEDMGLNGVLDDGQLGGPQLNDDGNDAEGAANQDTNQDQVPRTTSPPSHSSPPHLALAENKSVSDLKECLACGPYRWIRLTMTSKGMTSQTPIPAGSNPIRSRWPGASNAAFNHGPESGVKSFVHTLKLE